MQSIPDCAAAAAWDPDAERESLYRRLGELTRTLHEALRELGYDRHIEEAVTSLPEARSRLSYISKLTGEAAEKVLDAVDCARADQDALVAQSGRSPPRRSGRRAGRADRRDRQPAAGRRAAREPGLLSDSARRRGGTPE